MTDRDKLIKLISQADDRVLSIPYIGENGAEALADYLLENDVDIIRHGKWLMSLVDEPWQKGYHGRCSVCGKHYTYNTNKMPRRCDYCDALMDDGGRNDA